MLFPSVYIVRTRIKVSRICESAFFDIIERYPDGLPCYWACASYQRLWLVPPTTVCDERAPTTLVANIAANAQRAALHTVSVGVCLVSVFVIVVAVRVLDSCIEGMLMLRLHAAPRLKSRHADKHQSSFRS